MTSTTRIHLLALALAAAVIATYANSLPGAFVFDDESSILENESIRHLWPPDKVLSPPTNAGVAGRPVANLTFALNYAAGGLDPRGYHAVNLAIHVAAALVFFGVIRRTLLFPFVRETFQRDALPIAFASATLWAVHPVLTAAVDYTSQRVELLMGLCYLGTLYGFICYADSGERRWAVASVVACALGMASKEVMATAPLIVLLHDRTFVSGSFRAALTQRWRFHASLVATWLILGWLMFTSQLGERGIGYALGVSPIDYALTECRALWIYLRLAVWPSPLVFDHGWDYVRSMREAAPYVIGLALLLALTAMYLWRKPRLGFFAAWFFIILAPSSSIVPLIQQPIAESRVYLSLAIVPVFAAFALHQINRLALLLCVPLACTLAWLTHVRNLDYQTPLALWADTVDKRPQNARAQNSLGSALLAAGRADDALAHFRRAAELRPGYAEPLSNLGAALVQRGDAGAAVAPLEAALRADPDSTIAHYNLANALVQIDRTPEALTHFARVLELEPDHARAHNDLSVVLLRLGRADEAISEANKALRADPSFPEAHYNLANALFRAGRAPEAIEHYRAAIALRPKFVGAQNNLGVALLQTGRAREAAEAFSAVLAIDPAHADARRNLEVARSRMEAQP